MGLGVDGKEEEGKEEEGRGNDGVEEKGREAKGRDEGIGVVCDKNLLEVRRSDRLFNGDGE